MTLGFFRLRLRYQFFIAEVFAWRRSVLVQLHRKLLVGEDILDLHHSNMVKKKGEHEQNLNHNVVNDGECIIYVIKCAT